MMRRVHTLVAIGIAISGAACTVDQASTLTPSGPSGLATSLRVTATPDMISRDGASQSTVEVTAIGPDGQAKAGLAVHIDMGVDGLITDRPDLARKLLEERRIRWR